MTFILQVCPFEKSGGAEFIVEKLVNSPSSLKKRALYFSGHNNSERTSNKIFFQLTPRNPLNIVKLRFYLKSASKKYKKVVVHAHLTWPLYFVAIAAFGLDVTLVYTEHSTFNMRRRYSFFRSIDRLIYSRYTKIVGISQATSSALVSWLGHNFKEKIMTIPNGAKLFSYLERSIKSEEDKIKLLSVGSLKSLKGFETTIKAVASLADQVDSYTLVGSGPDLSKLQKLAKEYGVSDRILFASWSDDLEGYYHDADILLIPSHWEGFGLVAVEGMSTGLPVIASNVPGLSEVADPELASVILVNDFKNTEFWVDAINAMIPKLQVSSNGMASVSRLRAEQFRIQNMVDSYHQLYGSIVGVK